MLGNDLPICTAVISEPTFWTSYASCGDPGASPWGQLFVVSLVVLLLLSVVMVVQYRSPKKTSKGVKIAAAVAGAAVISSLVWATIAIYSHS